jgi:hypothetical protein
MPRTLANPTPRDYEFALFGENPLYSERGNARIEIPNTDLTKSKSIMRIIGILLISIGLLTLALPYLTFTKREKVLDIGPVEAVAETRERIPISPVLGAVIFVAGAGIVIASMIRKGAG